MSLHIEINISSNDLKQATENLVYELESNFPDCEPDEDAIALLIKERLKSLIESFISCPESHLDSSTLSQVESCFKMPYSTYDRLMSEAVPFPPR
ncbi:hypothetical protein [Myxosarcina sp. GI1]|uniref:hypothetical protein n=1 Tax=Myxosarcina sp. GI1 TaxID=1541065 RepID=UPI000568806C|nr:hypothetical protein [Myxosarcina sp. GI1]